MLVKHGSIYIRVHSCRLALEYHSQCESHSRDQNEKSILESCDVFKRINTAGDDSYVVSEEVTMTDCEKQKIDETDSFISPKELVNNELHTSKKKFKTKQLKQSLFEKPKLELKMRDLSARKDKWKVEEIVLITGKDKEKTDLAKKEKLGVLSLHTYFTIKVHGFKT